jgi:hypothetical protein
MKPGESSQRGVGGPTKAPAVNETTPAQKCAELRDVFARDIAHGAEKLRAVTSQIGQQDISDPILEEPIVRAADAVKEAVNQTMTLMGIMVDRGFMEAPRPAQEPPGSLREYPGEPQTGVIKIDEVAEEAGLPPLSEAPSPPDGEEE